MNKKHNFFEFKIDSSTLLWPMTIKSTINTINPHSYCVSKKDKKFQEALLNSDYLIPDGIGVVLACRLLYGVKIKRITGSDIHLYLLNQAEKEKLTVFYLGASEKTIRLIKEKVKKEFPNVNCEGFSPEFRQEFSQKDTGLMIREVNKHSPDILFIGMTAPKQEKWSDENKSQINAKTIVSIGAVFDFFAGNVKRAPKWIRNLGMEWLFRVIKEPKRLWKRYTVSNFLFTYYVLLHKLKMISRK